MFKNKQHENLTSFIYICKNLLWMVDICSVQLSRPTKKLILKSFWFLHTPSSC